MKILEEYLSRNKTPKLPIVHHCTNAFAIAKPNLFNSSNSYLYVFINLNDRNKGPANYAVEFRSPQKVDNSILSHIKHNDYVSQNLLFKTISNQIVEYDEYENFIYSWYHVVKNSDVKWIFAQNKDEAKLMLWESFIYIFDQFFSDLPYDFKTCLWESLNLENSFEKRLQSIGKIMDFVNFHSRVIFSIWMKDMYIFLRSYNKWISDLFNFQELLPYKNDV